ncbi:MAG: cell division transport system ATP-binding protein [Pseudomonadota bacterium]|nr:cell division transport system ATP-binding protein [Pseudomonadota bacterium]
MDSRIIIFDQVSKIYPENITAIQNISLSIDRGELVFLAGHSGAGKSTVLKLIAGIETATHGSVIVNGFELSQTKLNHRTFIRQHIGFIFQDHKILFDRNVFDNVRLPLDILGYSEHLIKARVAHALESVGLEHKTHVMPEQLSGGEQQRLCIARAIVHQPKILIADEPTANLDRDNALRILELFKNFHKAGVTMLISAHDESILNDYAKRIIRLKQGQFKG